MKEILKLLIFSDIFLVTGFGLINPIIAIFIKDNLVGGTIAAAGIASAVFLITRSLLQLIIAKKFDPKDRVWLLITGAFLVAVVPFLYAFSTNIWHIYLAQILHGIASAMYVPTFMGLFILNVDRKRPGFEWSIYSASVSLGIGIAAYFGALIAMNLGFKVAFFVNGLLALTAALILLNLNAKGYRARK